jgi:predicted ATPase/class 3 adenylate cyclase
VRELPTGTVTLLFTDIEGSTRLLQELGDRYADVLAEHRRVLRDAFQGYGGVEVDTQGDAFFYVFTSAKNAVAAAGEAQHALAGGPVAVRIGLHTCEPTVTDEGYVGADVHRAARIMSAGHGGQVLISHTTRELLDAELVLRDLGEHRLKDLSEGRRLYQLGEEDFPPVRGLNFTNLPVQPAPLIGRERELAETRSLLREHRLLTLVGPGGTGKTRLALQLAAEAVEDFENGAFWVPLAAVRDPGLVVPTIAQTIGAKNGLADHLRSQRMLILLDNFEQVVDAAVEIGELVGEAPDIKLLVTSRVPLHVSGEQEYPVPPLPVSDAVTLFGERTRAIKPDFHADEHVPEICRRLDGLPLAIELAAARGKVLSPQAILERLNRRLPLLTGGARDAPERQRTLRATIEWSHELLDDSAQRLFTRLAVFSGGWTLEAAEHVCEADLDALSSLVDKSLVRERDRRFEMLETIREYALERLELTGEGDDMCDRHAAYFARLADRRWQELIRGVPEWRQTVDAEHENLHAALEWSLGRGRGEDALAIGSGIWPFWFSHGFVRQGRRWLERALALPAERTGRRGDVLAGLGNIAQFQGELELAERMFEEALALFRTLDEPRWVAASLSQLADILGAQGDLVRARGFAEESVVLRRELGSFMLGRGLASLAELDLAEGDYARAQALLEEGLECYKQEAPESEHVPSLLETLGEVARRDGDEPAAMRAFADALRFNVRIGEESQLPEPLEGMAAVWATRGDLERAARLAGAAERIRERSALVRLRLERPLPDRVEPACTEGRAMSTEEAVEYALRDVE